MSQYYSSKKKHEIDESVDDHPKNKDKPKIKRTCLRCSREFNSRGKQNRICYVCKQHESFSEHEQYEEYRVVSPYPSNTRRR